MPLQEHTKSDIQEILMLLRTRILAKDDGIMASLAQAKNDKYHSIGLKYDFLVKELSKAVKYVEKEDYLVGEAFHSRNPLAGLAQAHLNFEANEMTHSSVGDALPAVIDAFGEGNPIVWAPVMVNILLEHLKPKADFKSATEKSYIRMPDKCSIALLGDWGADNDHAQKIAELVRKRKVDYAIHLGDIYYAGNEYECERFLENWPLTTPGTSFALNGNHEMYSRGIPYFNTVLPHFGQEASYFSLYNDNWQLHGLDTAYVPFSIDGTVETDDRPGIWKQMMDRMGATLPFVDHEHFDREPDARLQAQWNWLHSKIVDNPSKKNIFLSHNQPVSAYLPEFEASAFLNNEFWKLRQTIPSGRYAIWAWFFGHEHKCTIYDDDKTQFRARLIGNGAIPHSRQALTPAALDETHTSCTSVYTMNNRSLEKDALGLDNLALAISSFAVLTLDGIDAYAEYINEDGSLFLREKLSGTPNEVLEWGKGYGPLKTNISKL